jgi:hypothetical protein
MNRLIAALALSASVVANAGVAAAQPNAHAPLNVNAQVALASFSSLCDAHLRGVLTGLKALAATNEARSATWAQIEGPLRAFSDSLDTPAALYFADRAGDYWSVAGGRQTTIADRPYFAKMLKGESVVGELVVSRSRHVPAAIVAVPIVGAGGAVVGILGASVDLQKFGAALKKEMDLPANAIFFSLDSKGVVGVSVNPKYVMVEAKDIEPRLYAMLGYPVTANHGTMTYALHGVSRTVIYRTSSFTGWVYAFGLTHP